MPTKVVNSSTKISENKFWTIGMEVESVRIRTGDLWHDVCLNYFQKSSLIY